MVTIENIFAKLNVLEFIGASDTIINDVIQLNAENKRTDVIYWCSDKNIDDLDKCFYGTVICSDKIKNTNYIKQSCNYIIVDNPRQAFAGVLLNHFSPKMPLAVISKNAIIHESVQIGKNVFIGDFTIIEEGCVIGDNCYIGYNNTIYSKTVIGCNVKIGSNNTIGGIGFGYEKNKEGDYEILIHIGNVVINNKVEIGNNTCIDRAVLGSTLIHENVKIDNLVHIAHGVIIGRNSLIIANAMIGGSTVIGENVWVAPSVSIINKGNIGNDALVGMGAVVIKPVKENNIVVGNPAKFIKNNLAK